MTDTVNLDQAIKERFLTLPKPVQDAITSADVEARLRSLANEHKLHLDQWEKLENEVMLTLLGIQPVEALGTNIKNEVGIDESTAQTLAMVIGENIFEPIRQQLERNLEHPEAQAAAVSDTDAARTQILATERAEVAPSAPAVQPATPPAPVPSVKIARPTESSAYKPGEASHERASVHDDPYREPPV